MNTAIFVGDIVEDNGMTVKQNNMQLKHKIPLGALVEISYDPHHQGSCMKPKLFNERTVITFLYAFKDTNEDSGRVDEVLDKIEQFFDNKYSNYVDYLSRNGYNEECNFEANLETGDSLSDSYIEIQSNDRKKALEFANMMINYIKRFKGVEIYAE